MAAGSPADGVIRGYAARAVVEARKAITKVPHNMGIYANGPQPMALTARYLPHNGASSAPEYAPGSPVCSPANRMYSKVEYSDPNYRRNLRVSPAGYPRGYIGATTGATTDCTGRVGHHLKRGKHMLSRCRYLLDRSSVLLIQRRHCAHILRTWPASASTLANSALAYLSSSALLGSSGCSNTVIMALGTLRSMNRTSSASSR